MIRVDLVVDEIAELATLAPGPIPRTGPAMRELGIVRDAAIGIAGRRIAWIGPARRRRSEVRLAAGARTVSANGGIVVPGLVDAHTHALFAGDRAFELPRKAAGESYAEIARSGGGLYATVAATRAASDAILTDETVGRLERMVRHGATTIEVKSGYALDVPGELRLLRLLPRIARRAGVRVVPTFLGAHAVPPEFAGRADAYLDRLIADALPTIAREGLARFCDVFCEPGFFSPAQAERLLRAALAFGLGAKIHAEEFVASGGAAVAARVRATSADHLLQATPDDARRLAAAGVTAVLLPLTAFAATRAHHVPARAMVDAGVPVALGTDCSPNAWVESMPLVLAHAVHGGGLAPAEALCAATVNAAHACGLEDAGRLVVGGPADFAQFALRSLDQLGYRFDARPASIYRQGKPVFSA
ncbi:MAG TPA: imidazolonepropionase [Thermoplasmata archaeon]|nr:imidazolonepropionase [Thermoplasmata archaeon]